MNIYEKEIRYKHSNLWLYHINPNDKFENNYHYICYYNEQQLFQVNIESEHYEGIEIKSSFKSINDFLDYLKEYLHKEYVIEEIGDIDYNLLKLDNIEFCWYVYSEITEYWYIYRTKSKSIFFGFDQCFYKNIDGFFVDFEDVEEFIHWVTLFELVDLKKCKKCNCYDIDTNECKIHEYSYCFGEDYQKVNYRMILESLIRYIKDESKMYKYSEMPFGQEQYDVCNDIFKEIKELKVKFNKKR